MLGSNCWPSFSQKATLPIHGCDAFSTALYLAIQICRLQGQHEVAFIHDIKVFFDDLSTGESADLLRHLLSVHHVLPTLHSSHYGLFVMDGCVIQYHRCSNLKDKMVCFVSVFLSPLECTCGSHDGSYVLLSVPLSHTLSQQPREILSFSLIISPWLSKLVKKKNASKWKSRPYLWLRDYAQHLNWRLAVLTVQKIRACS